MLKVKYNNQYFEINDNLNVCIFSDDRNLSLDLLKDISGINKSEVKLDSKYVFDNEEYFKYRVFLDNNKQYINTLLANQINREVLNKYKKVLNEEDFERLVKKTNIRFLDDLDKRERLNKTANSIINNIFALSLYNYRIINDVFLDVNDTNIIKVLKEEYMNKRGNLFSSKLKDISLFTLFLDKIIILNKKVFIFNNDSNILKIDSLIDGFDDDLIYFKNGYYYYCCEMLRDEGFNRLVKNKKIKMISIFEIGDKYE